MIIIYLLLAIGFIIPIILFKWFYSMDVIESLKNYTFHLIKDFEILISEIRELEEKKEQYKTRILILMEYVEELVTKKNELEVKCQKLENEKVELEVKCQKLEKQIKEIGV